jgi:hypothetical protein
LKTKREREISEHELEKKRKCIRGARDNDNEEEEEEGDNRRRRRRPGTLLLVTDLCLRLLRPRSLEAWL